MIEKKQQAFFDTHATQWEDMCYGNADILASLDNLIERLAFNRGIKVLDLGCGTGLSSRRIANAVGEQGKIYGGDFSLEMLNQSKKHHIANIEHICTDAHHLPFKNQSFDYVLLFSCFPHFSQKHRVLEEANRVLKAQGMLTIAHLLSRDELNQMHHRIEDVVKEDRLPDYPWMEQQAYTAGFHILEYIDQTGLYIFTLQKEYNS